MKQAYFIATAVLVGFFILANAILVFVASTPSLLLAISVPMIVGILSATGFFYIFTHEQTFPFAIEIEKRQKRAEKRWLGVLPRASKEVTVIMLGIAGGPILAAFSAQLLIPQSKLKYYVLAFSGGLSGFLIASAVRGIFGNLFFF